MLEISQELALSDPSASAGSLRRLRDAGVGVCIDGFGMGCGSLAAFKQFPLDELKIHGSFVARMVEHRHDRLIVKSLIQFAHNFELKVIAEGVATAGTADMLAGLGCDYAQGSCFAATMREGDLLPWLVGQNHWKPSR
jgi:EAL domain-containing protein (putative c-di-GMP-specific phosphodiesterase class I)